MSSLGLFSIDYTDDVTGIVVGGDLNGDSATSEENAAYTRDGGNTWTLFEEGKNPGTSI